MTNVHNVDVAALEESAARASADPAAARQPVELSGEWQVEAGRPQFRGAIPYPGGEVEFLCDFPAPLGGSGAAPNPLAYCFWGGLACYAMTYALEAARLGVELRALRGTVTTEVDQSRALGVSERAPVEGVTWSLDVDADVPRDVLDRLKEQADARCPGVYCLRNPIPLDTRVEAA
jgi:uncharacterized OsmC-like protein